MIIFKNSVNCSNIITKTSNFKVSDVYICLYIYMCVCVCVCVCVCARIWVYVRTCINMYIYITYSSFYKHLDPPFLWGARCSSVVRAFTHGAMGRRVDPSWGEPIELFLVPAHAPRMV